MIKVEIYETEQGSKPFEDWLNRLRSKKAKSRIFKALTKMETGLLADTKPVGRGVQELRLHFEKGYRLYFGHDSDKLIILLMGSTKQNQSKAIKKAQDYWEEYKKRKKENTVTTKGGLRHDRSQRTDSKTTKRG